MENVNIKKATIWMLIIGIMGSALVAIIAVMTGGLTDVVGKSIATLALTIFHSLLALAVLSAYDAKPKKGRTKASKDIYPITIYVIGVLVILSSIFSVLGVWTESGMMVSKFYASATLVAVLVMPAEALFNIGSKNKGHLKPIALASTFAIEAVVAMLIFAVWVEFDNLPELFNRATASMGILASSLTVLTAILYFIHLRSDKKAENVLVTTKRGEGDTVVQFILFAVFVMFILPLAASVVFSLFAYVDDTDGYSEYQRDRAPYEEDYFFN